MNTTSKIDPFKTPKKKKSGPKYNNFIEAFKDIGASTVKSFTKDVVGGTTKNVVDIFTKGQPQNQTSKPEETFDFEAYLNQQEKKIRQQEKSRFEITKKEEQVIFSREQNKIKVEIETLQIQIKELAKEQAGLMSEIDKTAFQAVANPGVYHQNFFERLIHLIKLAKKKIVESRTWMQIHNHRSKKRAGYWGGVKKGGTGFMLSGERTAATQTG